MEIYQNLIGGAWLASGAARRVANINPARTSEIIGEVPLSGADEARAAVDAAAQAFDGWQALPEPQRRAIVAIAGRLLAERSEPIARALTREQGQLLGESRAELAEAAGLVAAYGAHGGAPRGAVLPTQAARTFRYSTRQAVGVVVLVSPRFFAAAIPSVSIAAALVHGNTVVLKPSTFTPETAALIVRCFVDAGVPAGVLNLVYGSGEEAGAALIDHPATQAVAFAGSRAAGLQIYARAAQRGIRAYCGMGGRNAAIVLDDADIDRAVAGVLAGGLGAAGQRCTSTGRVLLTHPVADAFLERLVAEVHTLQLGDGAQEGVGMGPLAGEESLQRALESIAIGRSEGAELLYGGVRAVEGALVEGLFVRPTILDRVRPDMRIAREELFGPVLTVFRVENFEEALAIANETDHILSASVYTRDIARGFRFLEAIRAGAAQVNEPTTVGASFLPFDTDTLDPFVTARAVAIRY